MEVVDLIEAYVLTGQKIDVLWNFYVTVHLAIAGFLLYSKPREMDAMVGTALSVAYIGFSVVNYRAKSIEYEFLNAIIFDLQKNPTGQNMIDQFFASQNFHDRMLINVVIHAGSILLILVLYKHAYARARGPS